MKKTLLICAAALLLSASVAQPQNIIATTATCTNATIDAGTAGCVIINVAGQGSLGFQITGTWTGTVTFSTSLGQNGADATFVTTLVTPVGSATQTSTATANGVWSLPVAGFNQFKIAITATGTGTAVVNRRTTSQARSGGGGGGGSGTPGGSDTQVQYNDGGAFGGDTGFTFNETTNAVDLAGNLSVKTTVDDDGLYLILDNDDAAGSGFSNLLVNAGAFGADIYADAGGTVSINIAGTFPLLTIGSTGVQLTSDNDGAITLLGLSAGADEDLTFNFDDVANTIGVSSSTGVTKIDFGAIGIVTDLITLGSGGVTLTPSDGAVTFCGIGTGADECLKLDFNATTNTVVFSSSTGVTVLDFGPVLQIRADAHSAFGLNAAISADIVMNVAETATITTNGVSSQITIDGGIGTPSGIGVDAEAITAGDATNYNAITGLFSWAEMRSSGTTTYITSHEADFSNTNAGTVTNAYGLYTLLQNNGGTITNTYGLYIDDITAGTQTNQAYAIYVADTATRSLIPNFISSGTTPSVANVGANSCGTTAASITGNSNSGRVTVGATSGTQCRVTTTITAPTGWQCSVSNTTTAALARCVGVDTTHFDLVGVFTAADVLSYVALPN